MNDIKRRKRDAKIIIDYSINEKPVKEICIDNDITLKQLYNVLNKNKIMKRREKNANKNINK